GPEPKAHDDTSPATGATSARPVPSRTSPAAVTRFTCRCVRPERRSVHVIAHSPPCAATAGERGSGPTPTSSPAASRSTPAELTRAARTTPSEYSSHATRNPLAPPAIAARLEVVLVIVSAAPIGLPSAATRRKANVPEEVR